MASIYTSGKGEHDGNRDGAIGPFWACSRRF